MRRMIGLLSTNLHSERRRHIRGCERVIER
jgi:hypothetical protein